MAILKKPGRCNNCGHALPAGAEVSWARLDVHHRHGGNGTVIKTTSRWAPVHTSLEACELAGVPGAGSELEAAEILLAEAQKEVDQLRKSVGTWDFDPEMEEYIAQQIPKAEKVRDFRQAQVDARK